MSGPTGKYGRHSTQPIGTPYHRELQERSSDARHHLESAAASVFKGIRASTQVATLEIKLTNASWRENGYQDNYVGYEAKNLLTATSTQIHAIY